MAKTKAIHVQTQFPELRAHIERPNGGLGNPNWWLVWTDASKADYRGSFWYSGGSWNTQFSQIYQPEGNPRISELIVRFSTARDCIAYLTDEDIQAESLVGLDLGVV